MAPEPTRDGKTGLVTERELADFDPSTGHLHGCDDAANECSCLGLLFAVAEDAVRRAPTLVATDVSYCLTHGATDHDGKKWTACRFRQLFYFENPTDEHTLMWSDEIGAEAVTVDVGYAHTLTERGGPCREDCPHPAHNGRTYGAGE